MSGPRKQSLHAGIYSTDGIGEWQSEKKETFPRSKPCTNKHSWLYGDACAVCCICGLTIPKDEACKHHA